MTKKVETWMPFLVDKYLGDTTDLTTEQHGAYILLLLSMWKRDGVLPLDAQRLASICKLTLPRWRLHSPILLAFFTVDAVAHTLTQKRLGKELIRAKANVLQRSFAGKASAAERRRLADEQREAQQKVNEMATAVETSVATAESTADPTDGATDEQREAQRNVKPIPITPSLREEEKGERKRPPFFDAGAIDLPHWLDLELWQRWCGDRKKRGKAITEEGAKAQLKRLEKFRAEGIKPADVIEHALASGNQGLFPPPETKGQNGGARSFREKDASIASARVHELSGGIAGAKPRQQAVEIIDEPAPTRRLG